MAAGDTVITTVVQVTEDPRGTNTRGGRIAIEASPKTPHNPVFYFICK
jgi:hypothetical protein